VIYGNYSRKMANEKKWRMVKPLRGGAYSRIRVFAIFGDLYIEKGQREKRGNKNSCFLFPILLRKKGEYANTRITVGTKGLRHSPSIRHSPFSSAFELQPLKQRNLDHERRKHIACKTADIVAWRIPGSRSGRRSALTNIARLPVEKGTVRVGLLRVRELPGNADFSAKNFREILTGIATYEV